MFGYHLFKFDIYELAESYSFLLANTLKNMRNTKDDKTAGELCHFFNQLVLEIPRKNKYNKEKLKECFLSCYQNPEKDVIELFDNIATFCCDYSKFDPGIIWDKLGEINGFKW